MHDLDTLESVPPITPPPSDLPDEKDKERFNAGEYRPPLMFEPRRAPRLWVVIAMFAVLGLCGLIVAKC